MKRVKDSEVINNACYNGEMYMYNDLEQKKKDSREEWQMWDLYDRFEDKKEKDPPIPRNIRTLIQSNQSAAKQRET